jgi:hypothetical protein
LQRRCASMTRLRIKRANDGGYALMAALAITLVLLSAVAALTPMAIRTATNTGRFRDRAGAISAAEGQVDAMVSTITAALTASPTAPAWPCTPVGAIVTDSGPHSINTTTTVTYFDANGSDVGCPGAGTLVRSATVRSVATSPALPNTLPVRRVMEALLAFSGGDTVPVSIYTLPRSMFSEKDVTFQNTVKVTQAPGVSMSSLYTNGNFTCANNTGLAGDLVVQGGVSMANSCAVGGSVTSGGAVDLLSTQASIGGSVVAVGNVNVAGGSHAIGGTIRAGGFAWWSGCTSGLCTSGDLSISAPVRESLPNLPWDADVEAAWVHAGWSVVKFENPEDCNVTGGTNAPGQWLLTNSTVAGPKTVVRTTCPVVIGNTGTISVARDVAVIADGEIAFNTSAHFQAAAVQSLYFIQPTKSVSPDCGTGGIALNNNVTFAPTISLMLFTPCNITAAQSLDVTGQVYAGGSLDFNNSVALQFRPMPIPIATSSSSTVNAYIVSVRGKRENQ